jgi:MFS family permease
MLAGQVLGPLPGALVASRLGFQLTFELGGLMIAGCAALTQWALARPPEAAASTATTRSLPVRDVAVAAALVLVGSTQEAFLASILPAVLPGLGVSPEGTVEAGGLLLFVSSAAAALGGLTAPYLAAEVGERRILAALLTGSSVLLAMLSLSGSLGWFTFFRVLQSLAIAPLFPLVVARVARHGGGDAIGIVNAARVGSNFVGAVFATSVLAWAPPAVLYLLLGAAGLASVLLVRR